MRPKALVNRERRSAISRQSTEAGCYRLVMENSEEGGRFLVAIHHTPQGCFAQVVNLPGCFARGANEVEALENVRAAIRAFVALTQLARREKPRVSLEISA